ncbi:MAG: transposase, partial [Candidatus Dormibacteraeota bacterium]|nr:transposase [Candidatus Dormibacteraeota bacterium]
MERKKPRPRRSFTPEFKAEVVELVRQPGKTAGWTRTAAPGPPEPEPEPEPESAYDPEDDPAWT